jgi:predicted nucleotidyltransferase component of viral defense system
MVPASRFRVPMLHHAAIPITVLEVLEQVAPCLADQGFSLAGGTSLALRFGHRISVDLDFFTTGEFVADDIITKLGISASEVMDRSKGTLRLLVDGVKIDCLRHAYPLLNPPDVIENLRMWSVADVAAMKLNAITNRGSKKDFHDLHTLLEHHTLPEMLDAYCSKYSITNRFMVIRSLAWFEDADEEPDPISLVNATWPDVKASISEAVACLG